MRELAANALSSLAKYDLGYFASTVVGKLLPCTLSPDLCMRHGATLAVGEVILALHERDYVLLPGLCLPFSFKLLVICVRSKFKLVGTG